MIHDPDDSPDEGTEYSRPNKSALKREAHALVDLGVSLAALPKSQWEQLGLDETLVDALELYNRIDAHGAKARQRGRLGKLLRHRDTQAIEAFLQRLELDKTLQTRDFHRIESWRDRLIAGGSSALDELMNDHPNAPRALLWALIEPLQGHLEPKQRTRLSRELFRQLRENL